MSESGAELSEEDVKPVVEKSQPTVNRRQIVAGLIGGLFTLDATRKSFFAGKKKENNSEAEETKVSEVSGESPVSVTPEAKIAAHMETIDPLYTGLSPEQVSLIDETAVHLTTVYGSHMEEQFYPTEADKLQFFKALTKMGLDLNPNNPNLGNQLAAVIAWESGFSPVRESNNGSKGIGLIQFTGDVPANLETSHAELEKMSPTSQLEYVKKYFQSQRSSFGGDFSSLAKVYSLVINPSKINADMNEALFPPDSPEAQRNMVLDKNGDGIITVGEAIEVVRDNAIINYEEKPEYLDDYRQQP